MKMTLQLTEKDLYRMLRHIKIGHNRFIDGVYLIFSLFSFCLVLVVIDQELPWIAALAFCGPGFLYFGIWPFLIGKEAKKLYQTKEVFSKPIDYEFKPEGVFTQNSRGSEEIAWSRFYRIMESSNDYIFYLEPTKAFTIPKWAIGGEEAERQFDNMLTSYCDPNKIFRD